MAEPSHVPAGRRKLVVAFARLSPEKQLDRMIGAFVNATTDSRLSDWLLEIHGEGAERDKLQRIIDQTPGGADRVRLMGWTTQTDAVYRTAQLNLLTSSFEGFGMTIVEGAQHGVSTLAFGCAPGVAELVQRLGGVAVAPNDDEAFTARLHALLLSPSDLRRRGITAEENVRRFDPDHVLDDWGRVISHAYAARAAAAFQG